MVPPATGEIEQVVLLNDQGQPIGTAEKEAAHRSGGRLHRAFSILVLNRQGDLLLQQRALGKYHFAGLWSNSCCGHPRPGEDPVQAGERRLREELGFAAALTPLFRFRYEARDDASGLTEKELVDVLLGRFDGTPSPDHTEVMDWRWQCLPSVKAEVLANPARFTPWFALLLPHLGDETP